MSEPTATPVPAASRPVSSWNVANALTVLRLLLVPLFAVLLLHDNGARDGWRVAAFGAFAVASVTDRVDGDVARKWGLVTNFGIIADPIADKALTGTALVCLSLLDQLAWWVTVLVIVREVGVTALRFVVIRHGVMPASRGGKIKTFLQGLAIGLYVLPLGGALATTAAVVMAVAVLVTLVTGVDYVVRAVTLRRTSERAQLKRQRRARG
jgi:CDP-diacylglycerol---glycerol-3-phosphate 3-phosphatidyltransferase